jgi:hypothetical protein
MARKLLAARQGVLKFVDPSAAARRTQPQPQSEQQPQHQQPETEPKPEDAVHAETEVQSVQEANASASEAPLSTLFLSLAAWFAPHMPSAIIELFEKHSGKSVDAMEKASILVGTDPSDESLSAVMNCPRPRVVLRPSWIEECIRENRRIMNVGAYTLSMVAVPDMIPMGIDLMIAEEKDRRKRHRQANSKKRGRPTATASQQETEDAAPAPAAKVARTESTPAAASTPKRVTTTVSLFSRGMPQRASASRPNPYAVLNQVVRTHQQERKENLPMPAEPQRRVTITPIRGPVALSQVTPIRVKPPVVQLLKSRTLSASSVWKHNTPGA